MSPKPATAFVVLMLMALSVGAGLKVETAADFPEAISALAVAPLDCENDLACEQIEQALTEDILDILGPETVVVISPEEVREEMANNEAKTGSATASLMAIARRHGCDAVLVARVRSSGGLEDTLATNDYGVGAANTIEILDAEGRALMRGWASIPTHPWQQNTANFARVHFNAIAGFEQILERSVESADPHSRNNRAIPGEPSGSSNRIRQ